MVWITSDDSHCDWVIRLPLVSRSVHIARVFLPSTIREDSQESCRPWCIPLRFHPISCAFPQIKLVICFVFISSGHHQGAVRFFSPHCTFQKKDGHLHPLMSWVLKLFFNLLTLKPCTIRPRVTSRFHVIVTQTPEALHYQVSLLFHECAIC